MGSKIYDNWERLMKAVLRREQFRQLALKHSRDFSFESSSTVSFRSSFQLHDQSIVFSWDTLLSFPYNLSEMNDDSNWERISPRLVSSTSAILRSFFLIVGARELTFSWGDFPESISTSRSGYSSAFDLIELISVKWFDIRAKMKTRMLTPKAIYGAYLVFKLTTKSKGFESVKAMIRFVNYESDDDAENRANVVHLVPVDNKIGEIAVKREDGWMEVPIGMFYIDEGDNGDGEVEARLLETSRWKTGLIIEGIEFRPLYVLKKSNIKS